jgi:hypothetical protein
VTLSQQCAHRHGHVSGAVVGVLYLLHARRLHSGYGYCLRGGNEVSICLDISDIDVATVEVLWAAGSHGAPRWPQASK